MALRINALRLTVGGEATEASEVLKFNPGLNVLRAPNSAGKSTAITAIAYALGVEGMLGPRQTPPFPHVMTHTARIRGQDVVVDRSSVELEISNGRHTATLVRDVKTSRDSRVVTVWDGPRLTRGGDYDSADYFARVGGSATGERGIQTWLADFLGWDLPDVPRKDGNTSPLYIECVLPTFFVEQKHGWAGILSNMPYHLGIRDVRIRSLEFLLALESAEVARRREALRLGLEEVKVVWQQRTSALKAIAGSSGVLQGLPPAPVEDFDPSTVNLLVAEGDRWIPLSDSIRADVQRLAATPQDQAPTVRQEDGRLTAELSKAEAELAGLEIAAKAAFEEEAEEKAQISAAEERLADISRELKKFQEIERLERWGSIRTLNVRERRCPTCQQAVSETLLPQRVEMEVMSVNQNVGFLKSQNETFEAFLNSARRSLDAKAARLTAIRQAESAVRARIRSLKEELTEDPRAPSVDALRQRVVLEERIRQREYFRGQVEETLSTFAPLSERFAEMQRELKGLPREDTAPDDIAKLQALQASLTDQLRVYGLRSLPVDSILVSPASYQPSHEGYDLGHDLSASDTIRTIWAYLTGILEVARGHTTNHPGLLVFDEPRQQHAEAVSFEALLRRASASREAGQQVLFATSEERDRLKEMLHGVPSTVLDYEDNIIGGSGPRPWHP